MPINTPEIEVAFGTNSAGQFEVEAFFYQYFQTFFLDLGISEIDIEMTRDQGLSLILEDQMLNESMVMRVFNDFCKNYGVDGKTCLLKLSNKTSLSGKIKTKQLFRVLQSNEVILKLFWPNIQVSSSQLSIDFTGAYRNFVTLKTQTDDTTIISEAQIVLAKLLPKTQFKAVASSK